MKDAVSFLYSKRKVLLTAALKIVKDLEIAEDVVQTVFLRTLVGANGFAAKNPNSDLAFLVSEVKFAALKSGRSKANLRNSWHVSVDEALNLESNDRPDHFYENLDEERTKNVKVEEVRKALKLLKPKQREAVQAYMSGLTPYQHAAKTGANKFSAATNFKCGIKNLKKILGADL